VHTALLVTGKNDADVLLIVTGTSKILSTTPRDKAKTVSTFSRFRLKIFDVLYDQKDIRIILPVTSRAVCTWPTVMPVPRARSVSPWRPRGPVRRTRSPASPRPIWIPFPIVVFTGQVPTALIRNDAFQEADIVGITRPCTQVQLPGEDVKELAQTIKEAFYIAASGRPGRCSSTCRAMW